jgi:hypothetical protein
LKQPGVLFYETPDGRTIRVVECADRAAAIKAAGPGAKILALVRTGIITYADARLACYPDWDRATGDFRATDAVRAVAREVVEIAEGRLPTRRERAIADEVKRRAGLLPRGPGVIEPRPYVPVVHPTMWRGVDEDELEPDAVDEDDGVDPVEAARRQDEWLDRMTPDEDGDPGCEVERSHDGFDEVR